MQKRLLPNLKQYLAMLKEDIFFNLNCHAVGTIESFDATKQKADVSLNSKISVQTVGQKIPKLYEYPLLKDCPVICLGGGTASLRFPIKAGDTCLVLFNDKDFDNWVVNQAKTAPLSTRKHSLSDAIVLVGLRSFAKPLETYSTTDTELVHNTTNKLTLKDSLVTLKKDTTQINLDSKVEIKNASGDLKTVILQLTSALNAFCTATAGASVEPTLAPASSTLAAELSSFNTALGGLLK